MMPMPAPRNPAEDADDEAAHEEQRRLARKQPGRERANPREIHHGTSIPGDSYPGTWEVSA